ncbi:NADPH:quinone reductase [Desulforhopalus singaporensis]|uniref:NADPH:quinone reductase n=2 Tax=Desulforhopalus singaporensis TaxID=91360 RepID=A0A1H0N9Y3_9BACT|nr:NADPH:quinone reductase [Desulforhopalus singaporensis]
MRLNGFNSLEHIWMASDFDGAFAQYVRVPASEIFAVDCNWTDIELATIPCAYGTAENLVQHAKISDSDRVLVTGASGGVGSAVVQLVKRCGAGVTAVAGQAKMAAIRALGADKTIVRGTNLVDALGQSSIDVVIDNVGGENFAQLLKLLVRGGRYVSSGAIAGPMVFMDLRDLYLKDLSLTGCTAWNETVFPNLIGYIERDEIRPLVANTYHLKDISVAHQNFIKKKHVGNFVLIPPAPD